MELNREQAIDILERFDFFQGQRAGRELWNDKPLDVQEQDIANFSRDVALLKDYIKELTEEIEARIKVSLIQDAMSGGLQTSVKALSDENERLKKLLDDKCDRCIERERADTVRKMQERLKEHLEKPEFPWDSFTVAEEVIDQIAKEMLEEGK